MINTYIISGFLGAGKTTFISHLLKMNLGKVMLLENEFGEVGVDASFFDKSLAIKEVNNGCICCSLQGDFKEALKEIEDYDINTLIIEPSGVGKLSDVMSTLFDNDNYRLLAHVCIVNVDTCKKYHLNSLMTRSSPAMPSSFHILMSQVMKNMQKHLRYCIN